MDENKKVNTIFGLIAIIVLVSTALILSLVNTRVIDEKNENEATLGGLLQRKNAKIRSLSLQLAAKQQDVENLQQTLMKTKNDLAIINNKLVEPAPVEVPVDALVAVPEVK